MTLWRICDLTAVVFSRHALLVSGYSGEHNLSLIIFLDSRNLLLVVLICRVEGGTSSQMDLLHISSLAHPAAAAVVMCELTVLLLAGVAGHEEARRSSDSQWCPLINATPEL